MVKNERKKRRTEQSVQPLGTVRHLDGDAEKDDEERRLESLLFGTDFKPIGKGKGREGNVILVSDEEEDNEGLQDGTGNALEHLQDADLFFIDDVHPDAQDGVPDFGMDEDDINSHSSNSEKENEEPQANEDTASPPKSQLFSQLTQSSKKKAAWMDPDDATLSVSLATTKRLRKLRDAPSDDIVGGTQYEARLRREFERINPAPEWAAKARKRVREEHRTKRRRGSASDVEIEDLLTRTDGVLSTERETRLEKGMIGVERLRDVNQSAKAEGEIKALSFHPFPRVPVLMTASTDRRVRLFTVDGHTNPHLQTVHIPELPITHAEFHPAGSSILLTGPRPFYYTIDLQSGAIARSPRGLWGSNPAHGSAKAVDLGMERVAFDPSGQILAVAGRRGYIHLVDWRAGGAQVIGNVKMNSGVQALWWNRHPGHNSISGHPELLTLGADAEVYVWDIGERRCVRRWKEEGGYGTTVMSGDTSGRYLSIG
ncbi:WD40 repeat-like protein [Fomitiporia mediterranea MF3/22]|uniref:WD40 repeat-like protein n=1 Tax=Fomitiporia mediterranea (strain MF3/22) TaxID=694068 RepID=UPI0004407C56|nr:WD40 repeat-like protein [Fomitiporia mediterranea MF3/22]EJD04520.1 WD40 repeat-like protein [Fomitiporia mediterranea MF3/22]